MENQSLLFLLTTCASDQSASEMVRGLLKENLISCGAKTPSARSLYRWKGKIEESGEIVALIKTDVLHHADCMARLGELHPYEIPGILLVKLVAVSEHYANWIRESLSWSE
jgi:periplasmic divalent cation tolerance protein